MTLECWPNGVQKLTPREHAYCARIERMLVAQLDHQMLSDAHAGRPLHPGPWQSRLPQTRGALRRKLGILWLRIQFFRAQARFATLWYRIGFLARMVLKL